METEYLIAIEEFCTCHNIDVSFINSLQENGLIQITTIKETSFIEADDLQQLEKYIHLYYELDINLEGIETINYLLQRIGSMQDEIRILRNKLRFYEGEDFRLTI
jgi:chaperone modulatory protein CbpM